jgi:hypothetical protein
MVLDGTTTINGYAQCPGDAKSNNAIKPPVPGWCSIPDYGEEN